MPTINSNLLPNETGQDLGSPDQQWDAFIRNLTVDGVETINGNALELQGTPVCTAVPTINQLLIFNGTSWCPSSTVNATQLQGNPVNSGLPSLNQALIWNGAAWAPANQSGGGGGGSLGYVSVGFSSTPTFTPSPVGSCAFEITLTGNVTSSTFTTAGLASGSLITFIINQDSTGGRAFTYPAGFHGNSAINQTASFTTSQSFLYNGTVFKAIALGVSYA